MSNLGDALRVLAGGISAENIDRVAVALEALADEVEANETRRSRPLERMFRSAGQYDEADIYRQAYESGDSCGVHRGYDALVAVFARCATDPEMWAAVERHGR